MPAITIICTRTNGIYRAGVFHPAGAKEWPDGSFTDDQMVSIRKEPLLVVQEEKSATADAPEDAYEAALAALALLRPFLKVPEGEAQAAIAELLHGGPAELPPVSDPILDRPLEAAPSAPLVPREAGAEPRVAEEVGRRSRRPRGAQ